MIDRKTQNHNDVYCDAYKVSIRIFFFLELNKLMMKLIWKNKKARTSEKALKNKE